MNYNKKRFKILRGYLEPFLLYKIIILAFEIAKILRGCLFVKNEFVKKKFGAKVKLLISSLVLSLRS
jgi:hypothetical protein